MLWDLDDTVLNTLPVRTVALTRAYESCVGGSIDAEALWRSHRGGTLEDLGKRLLGSDYLRFVSTYHDAYYGSHREIRPFDGVVEALAALHDAGVPMAIVTSKISWGAIEELQQTGLLEYFAAIVGFDDTDRNKPDPEPIFEALDRLLIDPSEAVYMVGDSPADVFAAKNAGCTSVAATWGTLDEELLRDAFPAVVARSPLDVVALLRGKLVVAK